MKQIIISVFSLLVISSACTKDQANLNNTIAARSTTCEIVTITQSGLGCNLWGVVIGGKVYPSLTIPDSYRTEERTACITYRLYEDPRECPAPCCGGIWAEILSIEPA